MNFQQLAYFVAIANAGSYSSAAKQLFVSQPALSKSIKNLEEELGTTFFIYVDKHLNLTDTGHLFLEKAQHLLKEYHDTINAINEVAALKQGVLHLGIPYGIGQIVLDSLISQFSKVYPYIKINITGGGSISIREWVFSGKLDIGATIIPPEVKDGYDTTVIFRDKYFLMVNSLHPLAQRKNVKFAELKDEQFIMLNDEFAMTQMTRSRCEQAGFSPNVKMSVDRSGFISELIERNQGIAVIAGGKKRFDQNSKLALIEIDDDCTDFDFSLITKKNSYHSYSAKCFIDFCKTANLDFN